MDSTDEPSSDAPPIGRRRLLIGGAAVGLASIAGAAAIGTGAIEVPGRVRRLWEGDGPTGTVPPVAAGTVRLERVRSAARGTDVGLFTAVPAGHGDGAGLPVCLVLHGASATTDDFAGFGLPEFLTASVEGGTPPFVLVGVDGGRTRWQGGPGDDPQAMLRDEVPAWSAARGFDAGRIAAHGWSMGGYGALLLAARNPGWLRAVAVLSPAVGGGDLAGRVDLLDGERIAIWCGTDDPLFGAVESFVAELPARPEVAEFGPGRHTRGYWNTVTGPAFDLVGRSLAS